MASNGKYSYCDTRSLSVVMVMTVSAQFKGEQATEKLLFKIQLVTGADTIRLVLPDAILTRDYKPNRLNVHVTEENIIRFMIWG